MGGKRNANVYFSPQQLISPSRQMEWCVSGWALKRFCRNRAAGPPHLVLFRTLLKCHVKTCPMTNAEAGGWGTAGFGAGSSAHWPNSQRRFGSDSAQTCPPPVCLLQAGTHSKGTPGLVTKKLGVFSLELVVCV